MTAPAPDPRLVTLLSEHLPTRVATGDGTYVVFCSCDPTRLLPNHGYAEHLAAEVEAHVQERIAAEFEDLRTRLTKAAESLIALRDAASGGESQRLGGKFQGVRLARSYVDDAIRAAAHRPEGGNRG